MNPSQPDEGPVPEALPGFFPSTHWSVVVRARDGSNTEVAQALDYFCRTYWPPLYAYVRRTGATPQDAEDATQGFFEEFLGNEGVNRADPERGRLRAYLLGGMKNYLSKRRARAAALKRGGGQPVVAIDFSDAEARWQRLPSQDLSPETVFERHWVLTLLDHVLAALRRECDARGKGALFAELRGSLSAAGASDTHAAIAERLGMTVDAVKMAALRLRQRYHQLLREEIARMVDDPAEVEDEIRHLFRLFA
jgi:RNA polymerase sigma-70 factor (ECF subfamily)